MTVEVIPQRGVRLKATASQKGEYTAVYHCTGSDDIDAIGAAILSETSATFTEPLNGLVLQRNAVDLRESGPSIWEATVSWVDKESYDDAGGEGGQLEVGEKRISFSTQGGTAHITSSKETVAKYPALEAFDNKKVIGITGEQEVQGCDIIIPAMKFSVAFRLTNGTITNTYAKTIRDLTGTVNNATFYGFDAGEVLFLGSDAEQELLGDPTAAYHFLQMPTLTNYTIGDITGINKYGHEYLWVYYIKEKATAADALKYVLKRPKYAFVERVYDLTDFSTLGIGTS